MHLCVSVFLYVPLLSLYVFCVSNTLSGSSSSGTLTAEWAHAGEAGRADGWVQDWDRWRRWTGGSWMSARWWCRTGRRESAGLLGMQWGCWTGGGSWMSEDGRESAGLGDGGIAGWKTAGWVNAGGPECWVKDTLVLLDECTLAVHGLGYWTGYSWMGDSWMNARWRCWTGFSSFQHLNHDFIHVMSAQCTSSSSACLSNNCALG